MTIARNKTEILPNIFWVNSQINDSLGQGAFPYSKNNSYYPTYFPKAKHCCKIFKRL